MIGQGMSQPLQPPGLLSKSSTGSGFARSSTSGKILDACEWCSVLRLCASGVPTRDQLLNEIDLALHVICADEREHDDGAAGVSNQHWCVRYRGPALASASAVAFKRALLVRIMTLGDLQRAVEARD
jgi:hypothetical protein